MRVVELWSNRSRIAVEGQLAHLLVSVDEVDIWVESTTWRNVRARVQIRGPRWLFTIKRCNNTYDVTHFT